MTDLTPAKQARLAAKMAEMMGWVDVIFTAIGAIGKPVVGAVDQHFYPFTNADDAIAFADHAEREGWIEHWTRSPTFDDFGDINGSQMACYRFNDSRPYSEQITPTCPFPMALTLALCRAVPQLKEILDAE
jgi:hypothetical protein